MDNVAVASINTFGIAPKANVPPSEDPIFVLTASQLRQIITNTVHEAVQPLQDEVMELKATTASQREEIASMGRKLASLEILQEQDTTRICLDIAYDRRRLAALEHPIKAPGKTEVSRAEKIERYLSARPDHRATFETLKGHLGINNDLLGIAIRSLLASGKYAIIRTPGDKRKRTLVMLPE